ncbi:hypothetical protein IL252_02325 [Halomicrobium sp. IBSBa]|uniref:hypothetical protein n=1 Tax=Halomicrobium sp. IBSBa TaxID=2778916 RepID=UPI001ABF9BA1|nr:hypothetical protein [Halomicrobium sp. IBSBa]MBO4246651.1 hypothetical protein [Halomicrobium sp. IBSBa]
METLGDLVADARDGDGSLFASSERTAPYSYADFAINVWKTGNLLRHYGVREGTRVAVVVGPKAPTADDEPGWLGGTPDPILAVLAAAVDGAVVDPAPPTSVDAKAMIAPNDWVARYELAPGTKALAYGGPPEDPTVAHLEREAWSENPLAPPADLDPDDPVLAADRTYTHGELLAGADRVVDEYDLTATDEVTIAAPLTEPGTLVAGVLAPMRAGATILLGADQSGTVTVGDGAATGARVIDPESVFDGSH